MLETNKNTTQGGGTVVAASPQASRGTSSIIDGRTGSFHRNVLGTKGKVTSFREIDKVALTGQGK